MHQSDHEYEERSFGDIQRAIDFENSMNDLESQLYYRRLSPKEVAQQVLKATCQFYDADWCGLIQVDLDLNLWTPFWWFNTGATDKTMLLTEEYESAEFLDRWVQTVRKGIPMVVSDAEATKEAYPAESKGVLKEADFSSPRISRLISYLLISRKNAISPQEITQTLWPDDSDNPAKNVKGLIYRCLLYTSDAADD